MCGGTPRGCSHSVGRAGLSPRVRGNPASRGDATANRGSIPACAGEPPRMMTVPSVSGVYPRVCGGTIGLVSSMVQ